MQALAHLNPLRRQSSQQQRPSSAVRRPLPLCVERYEVVTRESAMLYNCPRCGSRNRVREDPAIRAVACLACGTEVRVSSLANDSASDAQRRGAVKALDNRKVAASFHEKQHVDHRPHHPPPHEQKPINPAIVLGFTLVFLIAGFVAILLLLSGDPILFSTSASASAPSIGPFP